MAHPPILLVTAEQYLPPQPGILVFLADGPFQRRGQEGRRFPRQGVEPATITTDVETWGALARPIGPEPPAVIRAAPPVETTVSVTSAWPSRVVRRRRASHWSIPGPVVVFAPAAVETTLTVVCVAVSSRVRTAAARAPRSFLAPIPEPILFPVFVFVAPPISVVLRAVARRVLAANEQPHWKLSSPVVLAQPPPAPPLVVVLVAVDGRVHQLARPPRSRLYGPAALQTFAGPRVALARTRPRRVRSFLAAPRVVLVPSVVQAQDTIRVALAAIQNRLRGSRGPTSSLGQPTTLQVFDGPRVAIVAARPRPTRSRLAPPTVLQVFPSGPVEDRVSVALAAQPRRHHARSALAAPSLPPPAPEVVEDRVSVVLAASSRRRPRSFLGAPTALQTFSGPLVRLSRARPRPTRSHLEPPTALQVFAGPLVRLARIRPRPTRSALAPPTALKTFQGGPVEDRVSVTTAGQPRRHHARSLLGVPAALATFAGPSVRLARIRPGHVRSVLAPPPPVAAAVVEDRVAVTLAASARRRPRSFLSPPTTLEAFETFVGPAVTTARIRPQRVASALRKPTVVRVEAFLGPLVALARIRPRRVHAALFPPTVVAPKPPPPVVTTVAVYDEPGRVPLPPDLRRPHSRLGPPVVVEPRPPTPSGAGIGGSGFPPDWAARLLERVELEGRDALDDDEVALLLILGLL